MNLGGMFAGKSLPGQNDNYPAQTTEQKKSGRFATPEQLICAPACNGRQGRDGSMSFLHPRHTDPPPVRRSEESTSLTESDSQSTNHEESEGQSR